MDYKRELLDGLLMNYDICETKVMGIIRLCNKMVDKYDSEEERDELKKFFVAGYGIAFHLTSHLNHCTQKLKEKQPEVYAWIYNESLNEDSPYRKECKTLLKAMDWAKETYEELKKEYGSIEDESSDIIQKVKKEMGI